MHEEASKACAGPFLSGSRIASWLPSFSVEVMHTTNILGITQASNSQLNAMVRTGCSGEGTEGGRGADRGGKGSGVGEGSGACACASASPWENGWAFRGIAVTFWGSSDSCVLKLENDLETTFGFTCAADKLTRSGHCWVCSAVIWASGFHPVENC